MKILMASSEMSSLARTGGLGDVLETLPAALREDKNDVSVVLPLYRTIRENPRLRLRNTGVEFRVQIGAKSVDAGVFETIAPNGTQVFLIRRDEYFDRTGIYGVDGRDYEDNSERFIFFSKAFLELSRRMEPTPDILHVHDWQTALVPALVRDWGLPFKTVLTIHNLAYQGSFHGYDFGLTNLPGGYFSAWGLEFFGNMNLLKGGILFADAITTVSEPYFREIQTPEAGCGLHQVVRENAGKFHGILDGADYSVWNPATDHYLPAKFSPDSLAGKRACRNTLLERVDLQPDPTGPVFGMVTRLAEQKGLDILLPVLDRMLADDVRLIVLGAGDPGYETELRLHLMKHRGRFAYVREFDEELSHWIEAGSDITIIPSRFEPSGLTAIYSLKYGTLPIARAVGGLSQIIRDYDPVTDTGWGFLFYNYSPAALWDAIKRARFQYIDQTAWQELMQRAMAQDFSWKTAAAEYTALYRKLAPIKPKPAPEPAQKIEKEEAAVASP